MHQYVEAARLEDLAGEGSTVADYRLLGDDDDGADEFGASGCAGRMGVLQDLHADKDVSTAREVAPDVRGRSAQNRGEW